MPNFIDSSDTMKQKSLFTAFLTGAIVFILFNHRSLDLLLRKFTIAAGASAVVWASDYFCDNHAYEPARVVQRCDGAQKIEKGMGLPHHDGPFSRSEI